jgi:flagellar hook assembly protein FlgD
VLTPNLAKRLSAEPERFVSLAKKFDEEELLQIVNAGRASKLDDLEIEDIILNACRKNKDFDANEVIKQMATWSKVKKQGFPTIFESLEDYQKFGAIVKDLAKKWDLPADNIAIQGSSLRVEDVSKIGDLDVAIQVDQKTFDKLVERFNDIAEVEKVKRRIGKNGKIGGLDMFDENSSSSMTVEFYQKFAQSFGAEFTDKLNVTKVQISIIEDGAKLAVGPFLSL